MADWPQVSIDVEKDRSMCFVCGQDNPIGLKLRFAWDGRTAKAEFTPSKLHQGWSGVIHGGIITCLLDEAMSYACLFEKINTVTARIQVRIKRPITTGEVLSITGNIARRTRRLVEAKAVIFLKDGTQVAEATAMQFVLKEGKGNDDQKADQE